MTETEEKDFETYGVSSCNLDWIPFVPSFDDNKHLFKRRDAFFMKHVNLLIELWTFMRFYHLPSPPPHLFPLVQLDTS